MNTGILLKHNGEISEVSINMSLYTNNIAKLLNDEITFLGQILREPQKTNAIIIYEKNSIQKKRPKNKCILPKPFENDIYGDIFIISMNSNSEPESFTINDYNDYINNYDSIYKTKYYF